MRHPCRVLPFALAILAVTASADAAPDSTWSQHLQAGRAALARDDRAGARHHLLAVDSLVGGHTGAKSALATLAARDGRRDEALHWLKELAATGITRAIGADATFAPWRNDSAFGAVSARLDSNAMPISNAVVALSLDDVAMLAEDVTWDARAKRFLVSSIHRRRIVALDAAGRVTNFTAPRGVWGIYALALDSKRGRLWATTAAGPECEGWTAADSGRTAVLAYDLRTAQMVMRVDLPRVAERQVLGDLAVAPNGTVYVCESLGGAVYRLRPGSERLETLVAPGTFRSPQMPVLAADGKRLYVADYTRGVAVVDLASGSTGWLPKPYTLSSGGIDGLYRDGDRLLAIQNGTSPHRVLELRLDRAGTRIKSWRVLEQASERLGEPNHGVIVGRDFYLIGDSGWDRVGDDGALHSTPEARPPVLLRLKLGR